jgi:hypothetical protein
VIKLIKISPLIAIFVLLVSVAQSNATVLRVCVEANQTAQIPNVQGGTNLLVPLHIPDEINNARIDGVYLKSNLSVDPVSSYSGQDELVLLKASLANELGIVNEEVQAGSFMASSQSSSEVIFDLTKATTFIVENSLNVLWILIHSFEEEQEVYSIGLDEEMFQLEFEFHHSHYSE